MKIISFPFGRLRHRLPVMANSGMSDSDLEAGQGRWARRAIRSAVLLVLVLVFEAALLLRYREGKSTIEVAMFVIADLLVAAMVSGEIIGDLMSDGFRSIADQRAKDRLTDAINRLSDIEVANAILKKSAAMANERAAAADLKRAELETKLQPRMTDQRQFDLVQTLRGKVPEISLIHEADAEARWFADSLRSAFFRAGIRVGMYPRAAEIHSTGMLIYDPGMRGAKLSEVGNVLTDILRGTGTALAMITGLPTDVAGAPSEYPAILVGGRLPILPPHIAQARQMADAQHAEIKHRELKYPD